MKVGSAKSTHPRALAGRPTRSSLLGATGAAAIGLLAASAALACTVGVHGGLVVTQPAGEHGQKDIELFATVNQTHDRPPEETETDGSGGQEDYPVVMDPDQVSTSVPPSTTPSECFGEGANESMPDGAKPWDMEGDDDDVVVGEMFYGSEEAFSQAGTSDPSNNPTDTEGFLYGHGTFDVPVPNDSAYGNHAWKAGTYELCAQPEFRNNWDHFRIINP